MVRWFYCILFIYLNSAFTLFLKCVLLSRPDCIVPPWLNNMFFLLFVLFWVVILAFHIPPIHPLVPPVQKHHFHSSFSRLFSVLSFSCWVLVACVPHSHCCGLFYPIRSPLCLLPAAGLCRLFMTVRYWPPPLPPAYSLSLLLALMPNVLLL